MRQSQAHHIIELTSDQVLTMTIDSLIEHFNLVVNGYKFSNDDIWNVVAASAQSQAIESAANQLESAPDPSTVRLYLRTGLLGVTTAVLSTVRLPSTWAQCASTARDAMVVMAWSCTIRLTAQSGSYAGRGMGFLKY